MPLENDAPLADRLVPLRAFDLRMAAEPWPFEAAHAARIEEHWRGLSAANPHLWNGRVLKLRGWSLQGGVLSGRMLDASYAAFLAWRDWGYPDPDICNLFGSAVIRTADGALVFGQMAAHTATAGQVYPPGGNLDHGDITADGRVDVPASIARELAEETGLRAEDAQFNGHFAILDGPRLCVAAVLAFPHSAAEIARLIHEHNDKDDKPELAAAVILRRRQDVGGLAMPPYARILAQALLNI